MSEKRSTLRSAVIATTMGLSTILIACLLGSVSVTQGMRLLPPRRVVLDIESIWIGDPCVYLLSHRLAVDCQEGRGNSIHVTLWGPHWFEYGCIQSGRCGTHFE